MFPPPLNILAAIIRDLPMFLLRCCKKKKRLVGFKRKTPPSLANDLAEKGAEYREKFLEKEKANKNIDEQVASVIGGQSELALKQRKQFEQLSGRLDKIETLVKRVLGVDEVARTPGRSRAASPPAGSYGAAAPPAHRAAPALRSANNLQSSPPAPVYNGQPAAAAPTPPGIAKLPTLPPVARCPVAPVMGVPRPMALPVPAAPRPMVRTVAAPPPPRTS